MTGEEEGRSNGGKRRREECGKKGISEGYWQLWRKAIEEGTDGLMAGLCMNVE